jgi:hypothetical protein
MRFEEATEITRNIFRSRSRDVSEVSHILMCGKD